MRNYIISFIILLTMFTLNSCSLFIKKIKYTKEELEWYNVYKVKDSLVFQSLSTQKKDTSIIISKRIYTDRDWFRSVNQEIMDLRYTNNIFKNPTYYENSSNMFSNHYPNSNKEYKYACSYLRSSFYFNSYTETIDLVTLTLSQKNFNNVYELVYKRPKFHGGKDDDPETLYWDKQYGIIKYITFNGEVWEKINWD
ncbi:hypothetical protein E0W68_03055 [Flavobacterium salilacus subsp. salilacus]|uniref:hypothetical protein n=1 Tax=Flavobacterium TaxID=237 RepID=UPI0010754468|nr:MULTISPECIES: hypothetical protein [Flavobacterium]KAF2519344.1 hypothetical protein E0W68_03055 [Flavobacterium salilacus subsp. salilacus]MBE1614768.1 hypothetical protein [Flavobacterium sp. SaA2.13]